MSSYENWRDRCRLAAAAATAKGDELSARYLGSLGTLSDEQVAGMCLVMSSLTPPPAPDPDPAPATGALHEVQAAIARANGNRYALEWYMPDARAALRAVVEWLSMAGIGSDVAARLWKEVGNG